MPGHVDWLIVGDFNLYRSPEDRNRPSADFCEIFLFNEAISSLGLVELPLKGKRFTWTNKQHPPLLERLDWFFTSSSWTTAYLFTSVSTLTIETSDHVPCLIHVSTDIPKSHIFRFENFLMQRDDFLEQVAQGWNIDTSDLDAVKSVTAKFKNLRRVLNEWKKSISNLKQNISNVKLTLSLLNFMEESRDLSLVKWNFKTVLENKLASLLQQQKAYWKQGGKIKWATLGDAPTKFFHAQATIKFRRNLVAKLIDDQGIELVSHKDKELLIW
jgi:hypothetical protein